MTREEFISILEEKGYRYLIEGETLIVDYKWYVWLNSLTSLPSGVQFKNEEYVSLNALKSLPAGVEFKNEGNVWLNGLTSLPAGVQFKNGGRVRLNSLTSLPIADLDSMFQNRGDVLIQGFWISDEEFLESRWKSAELKLEQ